MPVFKEPGEPVALAANRPQRPNGTGFLCHNRVVGLPIQYPSPGSLLAA